jgi:hypothetical protein
MEHRLYRDFTPITAGAYCRLSAVDARREPGMRINTDREYIVVTKLGSLIPANKSGIFGQNAF